MYQSCRMVIWDREELSAAFPDQRHYDLALLPRHLSGSFQLVLQEATQEPAAAGYSDQHRELRQVVSNEHLRRTKTNLSWTTNHNPTKNLYVEIRDCFSSKKSCPVLYYESRIRGPRIILGLEFLQRTHLLDRRGSIRSFDLKFVRIHAVDLSQFSFLFYINRLKFWPVFCFFFVISFYSNLVVNLFITECCWFDPDLLYRFDHTMFPVHPVFHL